MEMVVAYAFVIGKISPLPLNLVNKSVSRETPMLADLRLTQISNERKPAIGRLFWCKIKVGKNAAYKTRQMKLWTALLS